jgi:hypothetical protein
VYLCPRIIESIERPDGSIEQSFYPSSKGSIMKKEDAGRILRMMRQVVVGGTGVKAEIGYYRAAGKTGTAQKFMRRGGYYPDRFVPSFIGLAPVEDPDVCILVVIDEPQGTNSGGEVAAPVFANAAREILPYRGIKIKTVAETDPVKLKLKTRKFDGRSVPDFSGLSVTESLRLFILMQGKYDFSYRFVGHGAVYDQSLLPGTDLAGNKEIILYLRER